MATSTSTETSAPIATAVDMSQQSSLHHRKPSEPKVNSNGTASTSRRSKDTKYRHVFATHSLARTSCLDQDSEDSPSFVGFRNLMILVLSMHISVPLTPVHANKQQSYLTCD
jgi:diacylglycerol O-acyltransferase-1